MPIIDVSLGSKCLWFLQSNYPYIIFENQSQRMINQSMYLTEEYLESSRAWTMEIFLQKKFTDFSRKLFLQKGPS